MTDDLRALPPGLPRGLPCAIDFEGNPLRAYEGEPVAVALFAAGVRTLARSPKFHRPRGAFCFEGHCGSCSLRIDGRPNIRSCMTPARPGLRCERQNFLLGAEIDLLAAADWMFPEAMDHHTLLTGNRIANRLLVSVVRQMGGSGTLPDAPPAAARVPEPARGNDRDAGDPHPASSVQSVQLEQLEQLEQLVQLVQLVDVCVVGGGPAGLAAATALAGIAPRAIVLLVDEQAEAGGSWLAEPLGAARAADAAHRARAAGVTVLSSAAAIGFFPEDIIASDRRPDAVAGTLAVATPTGLMRIAARRFLYATGAYDQNLPFLDNDRPGVISARACGRLAFRHGVRPGRRVAVVGPANTGDRLAEALQTEGFRADRIHRIDPAAERVISARGATTLRGLVVADRDGHERFVAADVVAVAATPAPASELPRQHGADVLLDEGRGGFVVVVDGRFRTSVDRIFACGDVTGYVGPAAAKAAGAAAAAAIAHTLGPA